MGRMPPHPRCFRKSGKEKTYKIRKLEEDTEDGKQRGMMERKGQRTQRRDAECVERKVSEWNAGGFVDKSRPMLALVTLFFKYFYSTSIQRVGITCSKDFSWIRK